jgi:hypothetical protein
MMQPPDDQQASTAGQRTNEGQEEHQIKLHHVCFDEPWGSGESAGSHYQRTELAQNSLTSDLGQLLGSHKATTRPRLIHKPSSKSTAQSFPSSADSARQAKHRLLCSPQHAPHLAASQPASPNVVQLTHRA